MTFQKAETLLFVAAFGQGFPVADTDSEAHLAAGNSEDIRFRGFPRKPVPI